MYPTCDLLMLLHEFFVPQNKPQPPHSSIMINLKGIPDHFKYLLLGMLIKLKIHDSHNTFLIALLLSQFSTLWYYFDIQDHIQYYNDTVQRFLRNIDCL